MILVAEGNLCDVLDLTSGVGGTVDVVDRNGARKQSRGDFVLARPFRVHEDACGPTV
jgi:hypothetical protein